MKHALSALLVVLALVARASVAHGCVSEAGSESFVAPDALDAMLACAGLRRSDLGWSPRGWWARYPRTARHKLDHYDDLVREPTAAVPFTRTLAQAVQSFLGARELALPPPKQYETIGGHSLYRLTDAVIDLRFGGLRVASPRLRIEEVSLSEAIRSLYQDAHEPTSFTYIGANALRMKQPDLVAEIDRRASILSPEVSRILGRLVLDVADIHRGTILAFRKVTLENRSVVSRDVDVGVGMLQVIGGLEYEHVAAFDDFTEAWDEASLWYAATRAVEALDRARRALEALPKGKLGTASFDWETPLGWIRVRGTRSDVHEKTDALLIVDLGGDDRWKGAIAASSPLRPVSLVLDVSGNDAYEGEGATQGAGIAGIGVLLDASGDDRYTAGNYAQGVGQLGFGALVDLTGNDSYSAGNVAQGSSAFSGIGLLADASGNDRYEVHGDSQGFAGPGGVGVLADRLGDDVYTARTDPDKSARPGYLSDRVSSSGAQGFAMGRFQGPASSHSWGGGLGALIDIEGNDQYDAGDWSQGTGYYMGTGILYDGAGDDRYYGGYGFSQASAAHFGIGILVDDGGDDTHALRGSLGLAFAHDMSFALFVATGGDDRYTLPGSDGWGLGFSLNRGTSLFVEAGGDDTYSSPVDRRPGYAELHPRFLGRADGAGVLSDAEEKVPHFLMIPAMTYVATVGAFLDTDGTDRYWGGDWNDSAWGDAPGSDSRKARNPGVGLDTRNGAIDWRPLPSAAKSEGAEK
jgi:hypothetical protein